MFYGDLEDFRCGRERERVYLSPSLVYQSGCGAASLNGRLNPDMQQVVELLARVVEGFHDFALEDVRGLLVVLVESELVLEVLDVERRGQFREPRGEHHDVEVDQELPVLSDEVVGLRAVLLELREQLAALAAHHVGHLRSEDELRFLCRAQEK